MTDNFIKTSKLKVCQFRSLALGSIFVMGHGDKKMYAIKVSDGKADYYVNLTKRPVNTGPDCFRVWKATAMASNSILAIEEDLLFVADSQLHSRVSSRDATYTQLGGELFVAEKSQYLLVHEFDEAYGEDSIRYLDLKDKIVYEYPDDEGWLITEWKAGVMDGDRLRIILSNR